MSRGTAAESRSLGHRVRGLGRLARAGLFVVMALFALTMAVPGTAHADFTCQFTGSDNYQMDHPGANGESIFPAVNQWEGDSNKQAKNLNDTTGMVTGAVPMDAERPERYTLYELNALRGLDWSMTFKGKGDAAEDNGDWGSGADNCSIMDYANNNIADMVFNGTKLLTRVAISIKEYASNPSPLSGLYEGRDNVVETLKRNVFIPAVPVMIMLTGLWVFTKWRQQQMREVWSGVGWATLTTIAVVTLLTGGNFGKLIEEADSGIAQANALLSEAALSGVSGQMQSPCDLAENAENRGLRVSSCAMYDTLAFRPWALGQFGDVGTSCIFKNKTGSIKDGACIPANSSSECVSGKGVRCEDLRVKQVESQSLNNIEALSGKEFNKLDNEWQRIRKDIAVGENKPDKSIYPVGFDEWSGKNAGTRVGIAFYSLIAALIVGLMVIVLSALTLLWHAVTLILIIMLPLIATIGIHPSQQKLLKGWLQTFIHSFVLRAGFGIILTVLLVLYQMILPSRISLGMQLLMLLLVTVAVVMMLKKLIGGAYSPKIAGAEDALGVGDMPGAVAGKAVPMLASAGRLGVGATKASGRVAAGAAAGTARGAVKGAGYAARGLDKKFLGEKLQKGGWLAINNSKRQQRKSAYQGRAIQENSYENPNGGNGSTASDDSGQQQQPPRRTGRVSQGNTTPPPPATPTPAPVPQQQPAPQAEPPRPPRVQPAQQPVTHQPAQPNPPQLPPQRPPGDGNRMPR
ncbi:hypothetical protein Q5762_08525 [Streptomyces sp. P9(2023)]|uniref:hypothetical protein n=1 Tax=Streptomyces sp. P9(2023) TaxID=3064394 RepID=UPI0028F4231B|nr:hypothetical protein [Streptomyces sp. P9(2023)]MDT9688400.1 hypothetical protein [Streptomyces sp. P9(2023)]